MAENSFFAQLFDISVREQVDLALCNSASDSFFILSGPPSFEKLGLSTSTDNNLTVKSSNIQELCPLLFTQSFADIERKYPDPQIGSFGTPNLITAPSASTTTQKSLMIGAAAYVTTNPWASGAGEPLNMPSDLTRKEQRWNLLKRMYFWLLVRENGKYYEKIKSEYYANEASKPRAVAPDEWAPWGNFAKSDLYKVPFGLMVLVAAKDRSPISLKYYEGCVLQDVDGGTNLRAAVGQPTTFSGTGSLSCTYTRVQTFNSEEAKNIAGKGSSTTGSSLLEELIADFGASTNAQRY